jgi:hypothetical protein
VRVLTLNLSDLFPDVRASASISLHTESGFRMCDLQQLHAALASTLTPNQQERQAAEAALKSLQTVQGYLTALFTVVSSVEAKPEVRQAGAIYFKNLVLKHWDNRPDRDAEDPDAVIFAEEEKASVRALLLDSIASSTNQTRSENMTHQFWFDFA